MFVKNQREYLTEKQNGNVIAIDLDFRFSFDVETRQHNLQHIEELCDSYLEELNNLCHFGSKHSVFYWGQDNIQIGCKKSTIEWFLQNFEILGKNQSYSETEILEYKNYIDIINLFHNNNNLPINSNL